MKGLLLRLSALDAAAENAVRVISFFDGLVTRKVDLTTLVRESARLAECPVGVSGRDGTGVRADPDGRVQGSGPVPGAASVRDLPDGSRVWLGRRAPGLPLDEILLERLAIAAALLLEHPALPLPELGDAALVELALSAGAGDAERSRALHLMGFAPQAPLLVLAVAGTSPDAAGVADLLGGHGAGVRTAPVGRLHGVLAPSSGPAAQDVAGLADRLPAEVRVGVGPGLPAVEAPVAWQRARTAVRCAGAGGVPGGGPGSPVVRWEELGALAVLAERLRPQDIAGVADVSALDRIAAEPGGASTLAVLAAYCATDSVRKAAAAVYRHHSTVAVRLQQAEARLGFPLSTPQGRLRLDLALVLRHLRDTADPGNAGEAGEPEGHGQPGGPGDPGQL